MAALRQMRREGPGRTEDGLFRPSTRGDLTAALDSKKGFEVISPESPRPVEMLETVHVKGDDALTSNDVALHELLISAAYDQHPSMEKASFTVPMAHAIRFLGQNARRSLIRDSLARLRSTTVSYGAPGGRYYEDVPLLVGWSSRDGDIDDIEFMLAPPIRALMSSQPRYAYLELAALGRMKSRNGVGIRLYRQIAAMMSMVKYDPKSETDNVHTIDLPTGWLAHILGYDDGGPLHVGHLRERAIEPAVEDLEHVNGFDVVDLVPVKAASKGAPIESFRLTLRKNPPSRHHVRRIGVSKDFMARVGGVDDPKYGVNQSIWLKAAAVSTNQFKAYDEGYFEAWLIAIAEALSDEPVSDGYATRLRGQRLLDAIASRGADTAAWDFITEETADPDLITLRVRLSRNRIRDAQKARYHRYKDSTSTDGPSRRRREKKPVTITQQSGPSVQTDTTPVQIADRDELLVVARDDCPTLSVEDWVAKPIREMQFTGETKIPVVILYRDVVAHSWERYVIGSYAVTESDIAIIAANKDVEKVVVQIAGEVTGTRVTTLPGKRTQKLPPVTPSAPDEVPPNLRFMLCDEAREECRAFYDACTTLFVFNRFINEMPEKFPFLTRLDQEFDGQYVRALRLFSAANPYRQPATTPCASLATSLANGRLDNLQENIDYATKKACEIILDKAPAAVKAKIWEEGLIPG